ncbi:2-phospho-L-lactate transferase [Chloroflexota bacterium]
MRELRDTVKIVALAGGVGGAKLVYGLAKILTPKELVIIVNTGDDFDYHGLRICPDLDTICYTLAGLSNPESGWGRDKESWNFLTELKRLSIEDWFQVGDKDLATHVYRTNELKKGVSLHEIVNNLCNSWDIEHQILPMSDHKVATIIDTMEHGEIPFQEYFVKYKYNPIIKKIRFECKVDPAPTPGLVSAIKESDAVILCPSNPWLSIDPILSIPEINLTIKQKPTVAISPIIEGKALKGPAAKIFSELGIPPSSAAIARHYEGIINSLFIDHKDINEFDDIQRIGVTPFVTNTIMKTNHERVQLAKDVLNYIKEELLITNDFLGNHSC